MDLTTPRNGERVADVIVTPLPEPEDAVVLILQERSLAQRIDRQLHVMKYIKKKKKKKKKKKPNTHTHTHTHNKTTTTP